MPNGVSVASTFGALLVGGLVAVGLSGIVTVQSFVYIKLYPTDQIHTKFIVASVWLLDSCHTIFVCASIWDYLIAHFGDHRRIDIIPASLALTIAFTAILTFIVHAFFAHRIFKLSKRNYYIMIPVALLAGLRLIAACVTTAEMIILGNFPAFVTHFKWVFTIGLALSSAVDILIAIFLCYSLQNSRSASSSMDHVINLLILYTFENGALTWLNSRKQLQAERVRAEESNEHAPPASFLQRLKQTKSNQDLTDAGARRTILEINVVQTVDYAVEVDDDYDTISRLSPSIRDNKV
ncbi:hypothetical protein HWV62_33809 [Athelia sp. TMB]|nr:hypothetical protein HWV62_33809 [Athelia sp. TMB]